MSLPTFDYNHRQSAYRCHMRVGSLSKGSLGPGSLGEGSLGESSLGESSLGESSLGEGTAASKQAPCAIQLHQI